MTLSGLECSDNLNEEACKGHTSKCCLWDGSSCGDGNISSSLGCSDLGNYSYYCCSLITVEGCIYSGNECSRIIVQSSKC